MKSLSALALAVLLLALPGFTQQRWESAFGGAGEDRGWSVQQTSEGGYIIAGYTRPSFAGHYDVYLIKTDIFGDTLWTRTYGGTGDDYGFCIQQTSDGGYIIAGTTNSFGAGFNDVYLIKINSSGDTLWTRTYGGSVDDGGSSVRQTTDGGYIIAGYKTEPGKFAHVYLIRTNSSGDTLWSRTYGDPEGGDGQSVQQTTDGGFIVAGYATILGCGGQTYLIKVNASGDTLWSRTYGGESFDVGESVQQTTDGGFIITGVTADVDGAWVSLLKTDGFGNIRWAKRYGATRNNWGYSVQQTTDGGFIAAGYTGSYAVGGYDVYVIKTDASGDTLWTSTYGKTGGMYGDYGHCVQQTRDGGYIITGSTTSFGNGEQVYLIKTDAKGVDESGGSLKAMPNPFVTYARIPRHLGERFTLYDITGRRVGTYRGDRIGMGLIPGVYFLKPESREARPLRIVKIR